MTRGDLLKRLIAERANPDEFRRVAEEMIALESTKGNRVLSSSLEKALNAAPAWRADKSEHAGLGLQALPQDRDKGVPLTEVVFPTRTKAELILSPYNVGLLGGAVAEYRKSDLLRRHGLKHSSKLLFCGPPGCGKTICAEAFANEIGLPLVVVRLDTLISSYLGETASNLRKIFDFAEQRPTVLFLDEFDSVGRSRSDDSEHSELRRVVNALLQMIDRYNGTGFIVAATNHEGILDSAIWRRFDEIVYFQRPTKSEIRALLRMKLKNFPISFNSADFTERLLGFSHAEIERVCLSAIKRTLMAGEKSIPVATMERAVSMERRRRNVIDQVAGHTDGPALPGGDIGGAPAFTTTQSPD